MKVSGRRVAYWIGWFLVYFFGIIALGGVVGGVLYSLVGMLTHPALSWGERFMFGVRDGSFYAGIWSFAISLVICVMRGYRQACELEQENA